MNSTTLAPPLVTTFFLLKHRYTDGIPQQRPPCAKEFFKTRSDLTSEILGFKTEAFGHQTQR